MGAPLVGCASHRLNLAVQAHLSSYDEDVAQIQTLMRKMKTLNLAAALRFNTLLLRQDTRWGSTDRMVERCFWLSEFLPDDDDETADIMPSSRAVKRLKTLMVERTRVKNVNKALQKDGITMLDTRVWVDGLIEVEPSFKHYLEFWRSS
ncbi:hypothetical protein PPTG_13815 [Phytophthora nicotianae INRA-310]|uniref:Uncharacterized protein n=1 Tax=Phytophthora nicotianae (strain INRA-310) TaxID=761204 RepID=W2Q103_PHYN3|nr:hypothetical protein PPTG_13815 [Phytophthora nicotianae INRA-310]ETN05970.1 hypothetical protein PPTG_13815 [Phytophthora nicotianae INRA-310]